MEVFGFEGSFIRFFFSWTSLSILFERSVNLFFCYCHLFSWISFCFRNPLFFLYKCLSRYDSIFLINYGDLSRRPWSSCFGIELFVVKYFSLFIFGLNVEFSISFASFFLVDSSAILCFFSLRILASRYISSKDGRLVPWWPSTPLYFDFINCLDPLLSAGLNISANFWSSLSYILFILFSFYSMLAL